MYVYRNGQKWHEGFNKTRPFGGEVETFRIGANRNGWNRWHGLLDELRMSFTMESEDSILASYESQRPDSNFTLIAQVEGPPTLIPNQVAEGFANEGTFSYTVKVFPSASTFSALGLPPGILINTGTGEISGTPLQGGNYQVTVTAANNSGDDQAILNLSFVDKLSLIHI